VELCSRLLEFFEERSIAVIRLGLHASREVEEQQVAGAYHPAMRELCESRIFLRKAVCAIEKTSEAENSQRIVLRVNPADISKMTGQRRDNVNRLMSMGYNVKITGCPQVEKGSVEVG